MWYVLLPKKNYPSNLTLNLLNLQNPSSNFLNWSPYISLKNIIWEDLFQGSNYLPFGYHPYMVKPQTPAYYCGQFYISSKFTPHNMDTPSIRTLSMTLSVCINVLWPSFYRNLISWFFIDNGKRKLMLVTFGT